jgi:GNAT superfamily N-acetyltransferase
MTADVPVQPLKPTPLRDKDYNDVKTLFKRHFDNIEHANFDSAWKQRNPDSSVGIWDQGLLVGAAVVRHLQLEYIFVAASHQGCGLGKLLLESVLDRHPLLYLIPVKDPRIIRWYASYGFRIVGETMTHAGRELCMVRGPAAFIPVPLLSRITPAWPEEDDLTLLLPLSYSADVCAHNIHMPSRSIQYSV